MTWFNGQGRNTEALNAMISPLTRLVVAVKRTTKTAIAFAATGILGSVESSVAADSVAPGAPGASANWTTGLKQGLGTAVSRDSKVWYTLSDGALSEVYFPSGDIANVRSLEFAVTDGTSFVDRESEDTTHQVELVDDSALIYRQVNTAKSGRYQITKTYITDVKSATVLMQVSFKPLERGNYRLFVLYDPAIGNSSLHLGAGAGAMSHSSRATGRRRVRLLPLPGSCERQTASSG
jgi:glucoamylase